MTTNSREQYQRWLDSPALSDAEWKELSSISGDEDEIESRFFAPLEFGTAGLRLKDEVLPLAAYGEFLGGEFSGVDIVTKGGSQGDETAIARCLSFLKEKINK